MAEFTYGDVRSALAETLSFSIDAFNRLIEMRDAIVGDMASGDYDPSMGAALKEIMDVLNEHVDRDMMRDTYVYNNFDRHVIKEILDRPEDAGTDRESRNGFLNFLLINNTHLWVLDRMKYTDSIQEQMSEAETERLFELTNEVMDEYPDEDDDVYALNSEARTRLERAHDRWYVMNGGAAPAEEDGED